MLASHPLYDFLERYASRFGIDLASTAYRRGLAVTRSDGTTTPIPITATPIIVSPKTLQSQCATSQLLANAALKMAQAILHGDKASNLLNLMSPVEQRLAQQSIKALDILATTRVDYFIDATTNHPRALEINATIPAMQGYSDIAAYSFIDVLSEFLGLSITQRKSLTATQLSNARALFNALLAGYERRRRDKTQPRTIGLLCQRHDAQLTEQRYLRDCFREWGIDTDIIHPDELSGNDKICAHGKSYDLIYRHIFVHRLSNPTLQGADYLTQYLARLPDTGSVVLNPPATQVEIKTVFALLSEAVYQPHLSKCANLSDEELEAIATYIPWTRIFHGGEELDENGNTIENLLDTVSQDPDSFVLKRAWDYGGRTVFIGKNHRTQSYKNRVQAHYQKNMSWHQLCDHIIHESPSTYIVQKFVPTLRQNHLLCTDTGVTTESLFVDISAYASIGLDRMQTQWGGVCRGSTSHIVNIVGGGGVLPLITNDTADKLWQYFQQHSLNRHNH